MSDMTNTDPETKAAQEAEDEQAYQQAIEEDLEDLIIEEGEDDVDVDPYEIPVTDVAVSFLTAVTDTDGTLTLGEAIETAALNLIQVGLHNYTLLLTDKDTGRQWLTREGRVVALAPFTEEEGTDAAAD